MEKKNEPEKARTFQKNDFENNDSSESVHHFTENPADLFTEIKMLEQRHDYTLKTIREKLNKNIVEIQKSKGESYARALNTRKEEIETLIAKLEDKIHSNLKEMNKQAEAFISELEKEYKTKFKALIPDVIGFIGFDF